MHNNFLLLSYSICWILSGIFIYAISLAPCYYLVKWGLTLSSSWLLLIFPIAFFLFVVDLILVTGLIKRIFVPKLKEGEYDYSTDPYMFYVWIANRWITEYLIFPFARLIYINDLLRYLCLRLYGMRLHFSTMISSDKLSDFSLLKIGQKSKIGAWVVVYGHVQPEENKLILAYTEVGDYTFIGANCVIFPGNKIGDHVFIGYNNLLGLYNKIGNNCRFGWECTIGYKCVIEDDVIIGRHCILGNQVQVAKGVTIPGFSVVPDKTVIDSNEKAKSFSKLKE